MRGSQTERRRLAFEVRGVARGRFEGQRRGGDPRRRVVARLLLAALLVLACQGAGCRGGGGRPHVILYVVDTLRPDHLGVYGYARDTSPFLDAWAAEAVVFDSAYAQASWTRPAVASLLTGRWPSRHGAVRRDQGLRADVPTLVELLQRAGYATAGFVANPHIQAELGFARGFDRYVDVDSAGFRSDAADVHARVLEFLDGEYLRGGARAPLFLYVHTIDPHHPYAAPGGFGRRYADAPPGLRPEAERLASRMRAVNAYDGEVAYADRELGRFLAELRSRGLHDDAWVVITSDHGEEFLEHGTLLHGMTLYEEQVRVPLLVRQPGGRNGGRRAPEPVRLLDWPATLAQALGLAGLEGDDGASFLHALDPGVEPAPGLRPLFFEQDLGSNVVSALRVGSHKLIARHSPESAAGVELYDLARDPKEQRDLAAEAPELLRRMGRLLKVAEQSLRGGLYVELVNGAAQGEEHAVVLTLEGEGAGAAGPVGLEGGDASLREPGRVRLLATLRNRDDPGSAAGRGRPLVDTDGLRLIGAAERTLELRVALDGEPLRHVPVLLGEAEKARATTLPAEIQLGSAELAVAAAPPLRGVVGPHLRVYHIEERSSRVGGGGRLAAREPASVADTP